MASDEAAPRGLLGYIGHRHDPLTSLVLTVPVFLLYHLGILVIDLRNGVDLVSSAAFSLLDYSVLAYVGVTVGISAGLLGAGWWLRKDNKVRPAILLPVLIEGTLLALLMLLLVGWATEQVIAHQVGQTPLGPIEKLVMAAGAGFHEELVFRAGLFAGGAWFLSKWPFVGKAVAFVMAAVLSSLVFSSIHYIGDLGDSFTVASFVFRVFGGLFLVAVYHLRGFAVAVYTHTLYDMLVFFVI